MAAEQASRRTSESMLRRPRGPHTVIRLRLAPAPGVRASSGTVFSGGPTLDSSATHGNTSRPADWSAAGDGLANLEPSAASPGGVVLGGWIGTAAFGECLIHRSRASEQTGHPVITLMTASLIHLIRLVTVLRQLL